MARHDRVLGRVTASQRKVPLPHEPGDHDPIELGDLIDEPERQKIARRRREQRQLSQTIVRGQEPLRQLIDGARPVSQPYDAAHDLARQRNPALTQLVGDHEGLTVTAE